MFAYQIINNEEYTTVLPEGELAYDVCHDLKDNVSGLMNAGVHLSFNMEKVTFLDSSGVGLLLQMKHLSKNQNGSFEIHNLPNNVKLVLTKLALNEFLNVSNDAFTELDS